MEKTETKPETAVDEETRVWAISRARDEWQTDEIEIDDDAKISPSDAGGIWVQAWVYLAPECE